jgi:Multidrug resistance efflux pump
MKNVLVSLSLLVLATSCKNSGNNSISTTAVKKGMFNIEVAETGELSAVNSMNITSPTMSWRYGMIKIIKIVEDGKEVSKGDTVIIFDPSEVKKSIDDAKSELEIARADLERIKAEQDLKISDLEADLKTANLSYEISKIELDISSYESDIKKKEIQLNLEKAKLDLDKASQVIANQKKINAEDVNQANLKIRQSENNLQDALNTLQNLTVTSPAKGIAVIRRNWSTGNKWQVGDQTWSGNAMIDLPDLSLLKVTAKISEIDISKIRLKQRAFIRLDAFADTVFTGNVSAIANLAVNKNYNNQKIKVFPTEVLVDGMSKLLMPGMTVNVKIVTDKIPNVLYVPLVAVFKKDNQDFVYIKQGASFVKQEVVTGQANNNYIIINKGVKESDLLALTDPTDIKKDEKKTTKNKKG